MSRTQGDKEMPRTHKFVANFVQICGFRAFLWLHVNLFRALEEKKKVQKIYMCYQTRMVSSRVEEIYINNIIYIYYYSELP